jgi:hypothetical protein
MASMHPAADPRAVRDRFAADHRAIDSLCSRLLTAFDDQHRERIAPLVADLALALNEHLDAEEVDSLPVLLATRARDARLIVEEHRYIRARMAKLRADAERGTMRVDEVRTFVDELRAHTAHEDAIFYRWANDRHPHASPPTAAPHEEVAVVTRTTARPSRTG